MSCRPHQRQVAAPKYRVASLLFFVYHTMVKFRYEHLYQYERGALLPFRFGTVIITQNQPRSPPCKRPKTDKRDFAAIASLTFLSRRLFQQKTDREGVPSLSVYFG